MNRFSSQPPEFDNPEQFKRLVKSHLKITLANEFKSPKDLDDYVKRTEEERQKIQYYDGELKQLDRRLLKPIEKVYTKKSWEIFMDLLVRIHRDKLDHYYKDRLFYVARKIIFKDFAADRREGTYR